METAEVVRINSCQYDNYYKAWLFRFIVQCPNYKCRKMNKHGEIKKTCKDLCFFGWRSCDWCGKEYKFQFIS